MLLTLPLPCPLWTGCLVPFHRQPQECASSGRFGPRARSGLLLLPVSMSIFLSHLGSHPHGQLSDGSLI